MVFMNASLLVECTIAADPPVSCQPTVFRMRSTLEFHGSAVAWGVAERGVNRLHEPVDRPDGEPALSAGGLISVCGHRIFKAIKAQRQIVETARCQTSDMRIGVERQARLLAGRAE